MSSDKPKVIRPFEDLSTTEYRPSQHVEGNAHDAVYQALKKHEDWIYSLRGHLRGLEIPAPSDDKGVSLDQANEIAQTYQTRPACEATGFTNPRQLATDLDAVYAVVVRQAYVYLQGGLSVPSGHFRVYRVGQDNVPVLVGALDTSEVFERLLVSGPYAFGARVDGGSANLTVISVTKPNAPAEVVVFNVGAAINGIAVQGRFVACACTDGRVRLVDISVPSAPRVVGTAS